MKIKFLILTLSLLITGCGAETINAEQIKGSFKLCDDSNSYLSHIVVGTTEYNVHCKNKSVFRICKKGESLCLK